MRTLHGQRKRPANKEADDDLRVEAIAAQLEEREQKEIRIARLARAAEAAGPRPDAHEPSALEQASRDAPLKSNPNSTDNAQAPGGSLMVWKSVPPDPGVMPGGKDQARRHRTYAKPPRAAVLGHRRWRQDCA